MHISPSYFLIICLALVAACNADSNRREGGTEIHSTEEVLQQNATEPDKLLPTTKSDTFYRVSGTEPFWGLLVAQPQIIFTSIEGDTLKFAYKEPRQASARPEGYVQVYELDQQQKLILKQGNQCPCSDGMSDRAYPYHAILILKDRILEGCGRTP